MRLRDMNRRQIADVLTKLEGKLESARLQCREGRHDAIYNVALRKERGGFVVEYEFSRRGGRVATGTARDTRTPMARWVAERAIRNLVLGKMKTGRDRVYQVIGVN